MTELVLAVLAVLLGSGICSGTEAALFSTPLTRVRQLVHDRPDSKRAAALLRVRENLSRPVGTIVILNNIANIVGSILVGTIASRVLGSEWLGLVSGVLTFLVIVFGEIVPKTLGEMYGESIALWVARPLLLTAFVFTPLVALVELITRPLLRERRSETTNEAEIRLLARIGHLEGSIEADESEMIQRVFSLNDRTAAQIMTPRVNMSVVWADEPLEEVRQFLLECPHSRLVVYGNNIDDIAGVVLKSDLLAALLAGRGDELLGNFVRKAQLVPEMVPADQLLEVFRKSRQHLAVVINEYGGTSGVVTLEDVLEVITGEIVDETDTVVDLQEDARQRRKELLRDADLLEDGYADSEKPAPTEDDAPTPGLERDDDQAGS